MLLNHFDNALSVGLGANPPQGIASGKRSPHALSRRRKTAPPLNIAKQRPPSLKPRARQ